MEESVALFYRPYLAAGHEEESSILSPMTVVLASWPRGEETVKTRPAGRDFPEGPVLRKPDGLAVGRPTDRCNLISSRGQLPILSAIALDETDVAFPR